MTGLLNATVLFFSQHQKAQEFSQFLSHDLMEDVEESFFILYYITLGSRNS